MNASWNVVAASAWPQPLAAIGRAAIAALHDELALSPKPGLVTMTDRGSHCDMDAWTFMRSLFALRHYFPAMAELGAAGASLQELQRCGVSAEQRMLSATGGINTHRGAIFSLGLLCAAAGVAAISGVPLRPERIREALLHRWGLALQARSSVVTGLPGGAAAHRFGLRGASAEAALGFPVLFDTALPAMRRGLCEGLPSERRRIDTLFRIIAVLDDCNLAHRGGLAGLRFAQQAAAQFIDAGGSAGETGLRRAEVIGRAFVSRRLSPGGAADMLAAACWMERICALPIRP